ncbi:hypothetical protein [Kribbella catacumbae]|uniref:hypothetical protein n=1 Tax=Kribbella catacumbae TaxID=460086 RepID=UPI00036600D9|nr:hypothetical protein [Kribbella catacumbae]
MIERDTSDGYDRIIKHRQLESAGTTKTTDITFGALERVGTSYNCSSNPVM